VRREVPAGDVVQVVADTGMVRAVVEALP